MPRRFQKAVKYLQENLVGKAGAPMLTIRWLPALGEQTTSLQQACAVHQKASLLGSRIAVRWLCIIGNGKCKVQALSVADQILEVKSNISYFTVFLYLQKNPTV